MSKAIDRDIPPQYIHHLVFTKDGAELSEGGKRLYGNLRWIRKFDISMNNESYKKKLNERYELCTVSPQEVVAQEEDK